MHHMFERETVFKGGLRKGFAWLPTKLHNGSRVLFKPLYYRYCEFDNFGSPDSVDWFEYYTPEEAMLLVIKDEGFIGQSILPFERFMMILTSPKVVHTLLFIALMLVFMV